MEESNDGWLRLGLQRGPACELLASCTTVLEETSTDGHARLRWYLPTDSAIVLGRGQRPADFVALPDGANVCQRPTGGGAVLMDDDLLSLDVVLPAGHPWLDGDDLAAVFERVGAAWVDALVALGCDAEAVVMHRGAATARRLGPEAQRPLAEICYASLGRGEVTVGGRKVVGLSQRRRRLGALVQCGLLRRWAPQPLIAALAAEHTSDRVLSAAVGLDDVLSPPASTSAVRRVVEEALDAHL